MISPPLKESLARYRGLAAHPLQLSIHVDRLLDEDRCEMIRRDLLECCDGDGWEVRSATLSLGDHLPDRPGLYMFVWRPPLGLPIVESEDDARIWFVLYLGEAGANGGSGTLKSRYNSEYKKYIASCPDRLWGHEPPNDRPSRLGCFLNLEDLEYWFLVFRDYTQIGRVEERLIRLLAPPLNVQRTGTLRAASREPAFGSS